MKNIYIIDEHQSSKQNGVGTYITQLIKCLKGTGHNLNLISFNSDEKVFNSAEKEGYTEYSFPICGKGNFLDNGALTLSVLRLYISDSSDNVFFVNHSPCSSFLKVLSKVFPLSRIIFVIHDQGWCASLLGNITKLNEILSKHSFCQSERNNAKYVKMYFAEECKMYRLVDDIIVLANSTMDLLKTVYQVPTDKLHLIPNGMEYPKALLSAKQRSENKKKYGICENEFVIFYAGRTVESKGIFSLLSAFELLYKTYPQVRLVIAGEVFQLNEFAQKITTSCTHVCFTGLISHEQLSEWCQIADLGILPSYTEQCSYFGIELLSQCSLIIASDGHNMKDMFDSGVSIIAHVDSSTSNFTNHLYNAMVKAISMSYDEKKRQKKESRKRFEERYALNIMRNSYLKLINEN